MDMTREQLDELTDVIEDTVEYACDKYMIAGETAWNVVDALAEAKLRELVTSKIAV